MPSEPLCAMPATLYNGDSIRLRIAEDPRYPQADGWSPELTLIGPTQTSLGITAEDPGPGWIAELEAENDDIEPGVYTWAIQFGSGTERATTAHGQIEVLPDPASEDATTPAEQRTFARKALDAIEAHIASKSSALSFSVFGRSYTFESYGDLLNYRNRLRSMVDTEEDEARIARGEPSRSTAWVRF